MDIKDNNLGEEKNISVGEKNGPKPLPSGSLFGREWDVRFDEPELTSDAGLAALVSSGIEDRLLGQLQDGFLLLPRTMKNVSAG
ncbi:MAG: hypothetical protein ACI8T1_000070 [Verrucomicrobiales bacterium]|jgi:hypothetical protein